MGKKRFEQTEPVDRFNQSENLSDVVSFIETPNEKPVTAQETPAPSINSVPAQEITRGPGRPKTVKNVSRPKPMNVYFDTRTHKQLGQIKLDHNFEMKDVAYIAIRKFLDECFVNGELTEEAVVFLQKKMEEING